MKKIMILFISNLLIICMTMTTKCEAKGSDAFCSLANTYGFQIADDFTPCYMTTFKEYTYTYEEQDTLNYMTDIIHVLLRNDNDPSLWCFVYRITTSPLQVRDWGVLGIGSNSDNWSTRYVRTTIQFRSEEYKILNYAPQNNPAETTTTIGVGLGVDGPSVSASVDYKHSELDVISNTKTATNTYETIYQFNGYNDFTMGDYYSYGMVMFRHEGTTWVDVEYEIGYYGNAWYGYNKNQPCTNVYTFTI